MATPSATLYFDFVDPISYLVERELGSAVEPERLPRFEPFELLPPPAPLVDLSDPSLHERWSLARALAETRDVRFAPPRLVPWSRKAHELGFLARARGVERTVRRAIYEAYLLEGRDIGRVDVLVELGIAAGLERTEAKAVLDVDRHLAEVLTARARAQEAGVRDAATLLAGAARLEGFHNASTLRTFLREVPRDAAR